MRQSSVQLLKNQSMTATVTSTGINLISAFAFSIQATWSGGSATAGTFKLQASNDAGDTGSGQAVSQPTNWTDVANSSQTITGTPGSILYDVTECSYRWVRLVYTPSAGTATLNATINTKGV
jgi:hypothetical protein